MLQNKTCLEKKNSETKMISSSTIYYDQNAQNYFETTREFDLSSLYEIFLSHLPQGASILDAGCGSGRDTKHFLEKGYQVTAFDGSKKMAQLAQQWTGLPVQHKSFSDFTSEVPFDGIWANASLLHVPKTELLSILTQLKALLKPDGVWYMSFRYGEREQYEGGRYFNDQTEESLCRILDQLSDLEILHLGIPDSLKSRRGFKFVVAVVKNRARLATYSEII